MKCDRCENEATVHELVVKSGKRQERHLCESCAKGEGLPVPATAPITHLLTQYITSQVQPDATAGEPAKSAPPAVTNSCSECGLTFAQFRQTGLLGCPECYAAFEGQLGPLLARAHDRGTHHKGKLPRRLRAVQEQLPAAAPRSSKTAAPARAAAAEVAARVKDLRSRLDQAIAAEQYEVAAQLRDELLGIEQPAAPKPVRKPATPKSARSTRPPNPPRKPDQEEP